MWLNINIDYYILKHTVHELETKDFQVSTQITEMKITLSRLRRGKSLKAFSEKYKMRNQKLQYIIFPFFSQQPSIVRLKDQKKSLKIYYS